MGGFLHYRSDLFAQKIMLPEKVFLLRGNHEVKVVNVAVGEGVKGRDVTLSTETSAFSDS